MTAPGTPGAAGPVDRRRRSTERPRPRRALAPVGGSLVVLFAWEAVAHSSGSGWVQAIGALVAAFLVVGMVAPALAVRRAPLPSVTAPPDATAGRSVELAVTVTAPLQVRPIDPPGPAVTVTPGAPVAVPVVPAHRGVVGACTLDIASAAPFGLLWWHRAVVVRLPRLLAVAPRQGPPDPAALRAEGLGDDGPPRPQRTGEPRGVRAYHPGDPRHHVHWPASAHTGALMIRESEAPAGRPVTVRVALPDDVDQAERVAEQALGTVVALLARGRPVELATTEAAGERVGPVTGALDAGRRLAFARPGGAGSAAGHRHPGQ